MSPIAVPDGDGTQNLQPLGVAGQVVHLGLGAAETGNTAKALTRCQGEQETQRRYLAIAKGSSDTPVSVVRFRWNRAACA